MNLAAGLTDLIEIAARSSVLDMSMDEGASFCADDASQSGYGSLPGSVVKPKRAPRKPASATKAAPPLPPAAPAARRPTSARTSNVRQSTRRPSYVEHDSESDEEPVSDVEEENSDESDEEGSDEGDFEPTEENIEEGKAGVHQTMSPTKQFILTTTGKVSGRPTRAAKGAAGKKIAMQLDAQLSAADDSDKKKKKGSTDGNMVTN